MQQVGSEYLQFAHSRRWGIGNINTLQKYIHHLFVQKRLAPTTVSSIFSLLRSFVARPPHNTHWTQDELKSIYDYLNIKLKHHQKKRAFVLSQENIETYCKTAPNSGIHLRHKLVLIIGIFTLARGQELADIQWEDIAESERYSGYEVTLKRRKTAASRAIQHLLVPFDAFGTDFRAMFEAYKMQFTEHKGPFFVSAQGIPVGRSTLAETPRHVAKFLGLPQAQNYTGHGLRAAGAMQLANNGGTSVEIMMYGNWTSESAARGYLRESLAASAKAAALINGKSAEAAPAPPAPEPPAPRNPVPTNTAVAAPTNAPIFQGCTFQNCTITVQMGEKQ
jgi:integrase